jgi:hypothetical protein
MIIGLQTIIRTVQRVTYGAPVSGNIAAVSSVHESEEAEN